MDPERRGKLAAGLRKLRTVLSRTIKELETDLEPTDKPAPAPTGPPIAPLIDAFRAHLGDDWKPSGRQCKVLSELAAQYEAHTVVAWIGGPFVPNCRADQWVYSKWGISPESLQRLAPRLATLATEDALQIECLCGEWHTSPEQNAIIRTHFRKQKLPCPDLRADWVG